MIRTLIKNYSTSIIKSTNLTNLKTTNKFQRTYFYTVDHIGQLFLEDVKIRNFTSCLKDKDFLDFFYSRIRLNQHEEDAEFKRLGYRFISPCGKEMNYIKPDVTVLVYQKLTSQGLSYAGSKFQPFNPSSLLVDKQGYLYHPSPLLIQSLRRQKSTSSNSNLSQFGQYSLLSSSLVLECFSNSLEMDSDVGGSFEWEGKRWDIGELKEGMVIRNDSVSEKQ